VTDPIADSPVFIILNPYSGRGKGTRSIRTLTSALDQAGVRYEMVETDYPGHGTELARRARRSGFEVVGAAGGDGTVHEVVNGLMQACHDDCPAGTLAVFPIGSGNDFAAMTGIPTGLEEAVDLLVRGDTRLIDVGRVEIEEGDQTALHYFDNTMGVGIDAEVTLESYKIRRLRGAPLYLLAAVRAILKHESPDMDFHWIDATGETGSMQQSTLLISVGNSPRSGGGFYLTPFAKLDDGILDVATARALPRREVMTLLPKALQGKHVGHPAVTMFQVRQIGVSIAGGAPVHLDGEVTATKATRVVVDVLPSKLRMVVSTPTLPSE
jgi:YegS/Rv2252/BmrU family lipid kinase